MFGMRNTVYSTLQHAVLKSVLGISLDDVTTGKVAVVRFLVNDKTNA